MARQNHNKDRLRGIDPVLLRRAARARWGDVGRFEIGYRRTVTEPTPQSATEESAAAVPTVLEKDEREEPDKLSAALLPPLTRAAMQSWAAPKANPEDWLAPVPDPADDGSAPLQFTPRATQVVPPPPIGLDMGSRAAPDAVPDPELERLARAATPTAPWAPPKPPLLAPPRGHNVYGAAAMSPLGSRHTPESSVPAVSDDFVTSREGHALESGERPPLTSEAVEVLGTVAARAMIDETADVPDFMKTLADAAETGFRSSRSQMRQARLLTPPTPPQPPIVS